MLLNHSKSSLLSVLKQHLIIYLSSYINIDQYLHSKYFQRYIQFDLYNKKDINLNDFEFLRVLGEGGFGIVFAAIKIDTQALYACKIVNKEKNIYQRNRVNFILKEREIMAGISHSNIVPLYYAFADENMLCFVQEYIPGGNLRYLLTHTKEHKFNEIISKFFIAGVIEAIDYLHKNGIVYRDLKLENILLDKNGYIKLSDFGLATYSTSGHEELSQSYDDDSSFDNTSYESIENDYLNHAHKSCSIYCLNHVVLKVICHQNNMLVHLVMINQLIGGVLVLLL